MTGAAGPADAEEHARRLRWQSLDRADVVRRFPNGAAVLVDFGSWAIGRAVLEPGWRWSRDVKPAVGTASCQIHHLHVLLAGRFAVRMDTGEQHEFAPNDVIDLPPGHDAWVVGGDPVVLLDISGNVSDYGLPTSTSRAVATMLMTDIVDSTPTALALGDAAWRQRLAAHNRAVRIQLERYRGREIDTTGDGFLAVFDSAEAALRCALAIRDVTRDIGIAVRIGVHTGEIDVLADDVRGLAVHATARIMSAAGASTVFTSAVTRALAEGTDLRFEDKGPQALKGLTTPFQLFSVESAHVAE